MGFLFFVIMMVVVWQVLKLVRRLRQAANDSWLWAAQELGLRFEQGSWLSGAKISGILEGRFVMVDTYTQSSGNSSQTYTRYEVGYGRGLNFQMKLTRQGAMSGVAKMFGAQDVEIGDQAFDDQVVVKVDDRHAFQQYMTRERRKAIYHAFTRWPLLKVEDDAVRLSVAGREKDPSKLVDTVRQLRDLSRVVSEDRPAPAPRPAPPPIRSVKAPPRPIVVPPPIVQSEPEPTPVSAVVPVPSGLEIASVCAALYHKGQSGPEAERVFAETFQGKDVQGVGVLRIAQRYSFDVVFGDTPAVRAMIDVYEDDSGGFGVRQVQAAVKLPEDMGTALNRRSGEEVEFAGRLVKFDRLLRKLYVAEGRLLDGA